MGNTGERQNQNRSQDALLLLRGRRSGQTPVANSLSFGVWSLFLLLLCPEGLYGGMGVGMGGWMFEWVLVC